MTTLLLTFGLMALLIIAMAVGVLMGREPIKGSCGGLQKAGLKGDCEICGGNLDRCEETGSKPSAADSGSPVKDFDPLDPLDPRNP